MMPVGTKLYHKSWLFYGYICDYKRNKIVNEGLHSFLFDKLLRQVFQHLALFVVAIFLLHVHQCPILIAQLISLRDIHEAN